MKRLLFIIPITLFITFILIYDGVGSEVMQRIAAPMIGGVVSSAVLTLIIIPAVYFMSMRKEQ